MTLPTVSELVRGLEPVTRDPFMDGLDTVAPHPGAARELLDRHQVTNVRSAVADVGRQRQLVGKPIDQPCAQPGSGGRRLGVAGDERERVSDWRRSTTSGCARARRASRDTSRSHHR